MSHVLNILISKFRFKGFFPSCCLYIYVLVQIVFCVSYKRKIQLEIGQEKILKKRKWDIHLAVCENLILLYLLFEYTVLLNEWGAASKLTVTFVVVFHCLSVVVQKFFVWSFLPENMDTVTTILLKFNMGYLYTVNVKILFVTKQTWGVNHRVCHLSS